MKVAYLTEETIEAESEALLAAYGQQQGHEIKPPIPVEDILEIHLGLSLDFDDLRRVLGVEDVIGALWPETREVFIDQSLEPSNGHGLNGRFRFTIAHEIGHWQLHRRYIIRDRAQTTFWPDEAGAPSMICRTSQAKDRIEWQADRSASCLLMPKPLVLDAWEQRFGQLAPHVCDPAHWTQFRGRGSGVSTDELTSIALNRIARPFARLFDVSVEAMRIRLETLGLLIREPQPLPLF